MAKLPAELANKFIPNTILLLAAFVFYTSLGLALAQNKPKKKILKVRSNIAGFTYLRQKTYSVGGQMHTVKEYRHNKTGMEFVLIPGGSFMMGSNDGQDDEKPVHKVKLDSFLMSKTEVTQKVYERFVGNNPSYSKGARLPVEKVSWEEAKKFCDKVGLRLPTEAQWEYACRAGATGKHYWGNADISDYCWYGKNSGDKTHEVGKKKPNAFGLHDMLGNVWEWCSDRYNSKYYSSSPPSNPVGPISGSGRVLRGCSCIYDASFYSSTTRAYFSPGGRYDLLGFRTCKIPQAIRKKIKH